MQHFLQYIQRGATEGRPLCVYFTNAANNSLNDAAGCWLLAAATAAGAVAAAAVAAADFLATHRPLCSLIYSVNRIKQFYGF